MKVCGQKVVKFCGHTHTHTRGSISSKDTAMFFKYTVLTNGVSGEVRLVFAVKNENKNIIY